MGNRREGEPRPPERYLERRDTQAGQERNLTPGVAETAARGPLTRSEDLAARMAGLSLSRKIAFAGAACTRARHIFAICHGPTQVATFDAALASLWNNLQRGDLPAVAAIFRPLTEVSESSSSDTLSSNWAAWLALATFEFPARLVSTALPVEVLTQCSGLMLTLTGDLDHRLGWDGALREGRLATAELAAQEACSAILLADPSNAEIPVDRLVGAASELARLVHELAPDLARATGWKLDLRPD
jgi:hypothetical protein